MTLIAREFVAAQDPDNPGVLVLSELAGAAEELDAAVQVNPYDVDAIAAGLNDALAMPPAERRERHNAMMERLRENNLTAWRQRVLRALEATTRTH
jgi:trehalose 6-phosphate synthase